LSAPDGAAGKKGVCPKCRGELFVPIKKVASKSETAAGVFSSVLKPGGKESRMPALLAKKSVWFGVFAALFLCYYFFTVIQRYPIVSAFKAEQASYSKALKGLYVAENLHRNSDEYLPAYDVAGQFPEAYVKGKVAVINAKTMHLHDLHFDLPAHLKALSPAEANTLVILSDEQLEVIVNYRRRGFRLKRTDVRQWRSFFLVDWTTGSAITRGFVDDRLSQGNFGGQPELDTRMLRFLTACRHVAANDSTAVAKPDADAVTGKAEYKIVPFGEHGLGVKVMPESRYEVFIDSPTKYSLDAFIDTAPTSDEPQPTQGIVIRFAHSIQFGPSSLSGAGKRWSIYWKGRSKEGFDVWDKYKEENEPDYGQWSFPKRPSSRVHQGPADSHPFDLTSVLQGMGREIRSKKEYFLREGEWHAYFGRFELPKGYIFVYVWDDTGVPAQNSAILKAFASITPIE
jgi:hypothetical protein